MSIIEGHEIRETLYESASSLVVRASRTEDGVAVILKMLKKDYPSAVELTHYRHEYEITRSLESDGVIRALDQRKHDNTLVMVLEDFGGESLTRLLAHHSFPFSKLLDIAVKITTALGEIHGRQIVHKDISSSNVVFNPTTGQLKIIDFGIATRFSRENQALKSPDVLEGTLAYMSPEQTGRMNRSIDYRTDFYSLGVTLYQMFTGRLPFEAVDAMELVHCHIAQEPLPVHEVNPRSPAALSKIIGKLMAKAAEARYQSAWGIVADLEACRQSLHDHGTLEDFEPGREDHSERFRIAQRLYGRDTEIAAVLATFQRASTGPSEMLLVSGYSGIGKSVLIHEIYKPLTRRHGYFIAGKFDQLQRNVPFSAVVAALRDLVAQLLTEGEERLAAWKSKLMAAFGSLGQVIVDVVPDIELIVGPQAPVPELGAAESMNRFNMAFLGFIRVFCGSGHPLVIFLDDLQWADSATLKLLDLMMADDKTESLVLIGAYRDNEVNALHPLTATIEGIRARGGRVHQITLTPLRLAEVTELVADTLHRSAKSVAPLAELVLAKTQGNPFFVGQFLEALHHNDLIVHAPRREGERPRWRWDIARIEAAEITDNVVELMIGKLRRLPGETQNALRLAACIGSRFGLETLALIQGRPPEKTFADLFSALQDGLILPTSRLEPRDPGEPASPLLIQSYRFQHDRVQQAAYALFDAEQAQAVHLKIGQRFLETMTPERISERIFEVVDHLDLGRALIVDAGDQRRLSELNLEAGKKAMEATAYAAALEYLLVARSALPEDGWESSYPLAMLIHRRLAEVEYLNGHFERSDELYKITLERARTDLEKAEVFCLLVVQYTMMTRFVDAIESGRRVLELTGIDLPLDRLPEAANLELGRVMGAIHDLPDIASLIDRPVLSDPQIQVAQRAVRHLTIAAFLANQELFPVVTAISVNLSLTHGNAPESALTFANFGLILGAFMGRYRDGYEFGALGLKLCEKFHPSAPTATVCLVVGSELVPWVQHARHSLSIIEDGYRAGMESGDILWAGYLVMYKVSLEAFQGKNIRTLLDALPEMLAITVKTRNQGAINGMQAHQLVLQRLASSASDEPDGGLDEATFLQSCEAHHSSMALCFYRILKAQELYLFGRHAESLELTRGVEAMLGYIVNHTQLADHNFYQSLSLAALYPGYGAAEQEEAWKKLEANQARMKIWAESCPPNFAHKHLLVSAEMARISGDGAAVDLYERAVDGARESEFVQDQALAQELTGRYWLARGRKERIAQMYLRDARYTYEQWGARRKVEDLEAELPELLTGARNSSRDGYDLRRADVTITGITDSRKLDLASVLKASQAISGEIALADLLRKMVRIVIENAGAQKGVILLEKDGAWYIEARGAVGEGEVRVRQSEPLADSHDISTAVVRYVIKTATTLVLTDATRDGRFNREPYVAANQPKSVLCTPILRHGKLSGILYLENNLSEGAFTEDRLEVLRVLASQAAISIENATLYAALEAYNQTLEQKVKERTRDILRTQNQLIAQEKMAWMGTLSTGMAHEIKNPLNFVNNFASLSVEISQELLLALEARKGQVLDADGLEGIRDLLTDVMTNMERIRHYGKRADGVVESMKSMAEGRSQEPCEADINSLVEEFAKLVHHGRTVKGGVAGVKILKEYDSALGAQTVIPQNLSRVLTNVLHNAYDAVEEMRQRGERGYEPTLHLQTVNLDTHFEIRIQDNGVGIPSRHLESIRTPFFTTKPVGTGHIGLGLAVSHDIVTLEHHGELLVETEEGRYARFTIRLPKDLKNLTAPLQTQDAPSQ